MMKQTLQAKPLSVEQPVAMVSQEQAADKEIEKDAEMIYRESVESASKIDQVMASTQSS